jgi:hypothetical protein
MSTCIIRCILIRRRRLTGREHTAYYLGHVKSRDVNLSSFELSLSCLLRLALSDRDMADNLSLVLRAVENLAYEQRPIPDSRDLIILLAAGSSLNLSLSLAVSGDQVLVEVKKTGQ